MANGSNVHVTSYLYSIRFLKTRRKFEMCVCGWVGEGGGVANAVSLFSPHFVFLTHPLWSFVGVTKFIISHAENVIGNLQIIGILLVWFVV